MYKLKSILSLLMLSLCACSSSVFGQCWERQSTNCEEAQVFCFVAFCGPGSVGSQCNSAFVNQIGMPQTPFTNAVSAPEGETLGEPTGEPTGEPINCGRHYTCYCEVQSFFGIEII